MSYSEETMNRISQALAGGALASTGADRGADTSGESEGVRERFLDRLLVDDDTADDEEYDASRKFGNLRSYPGMNGIPVTGVVRSSELGDDWTAEHHLKGD